MFHEIVTEGHCYGTKPVLNGPREEPKTGWGLQHGSENGEGMFMTYREQLVGGGQYYDNET